MTTIETPTAASPTATPPADDMTDGKTDGIATADLTGLADNDTGRA